MKKTKSRNLVIDASVARASGGSEASNHTSIQSRNFLQEVTKTGHKLVMTTAIRAEWNEHESRFAHKWRKAMVARRKLTVCNVDERLDIRQKIELEKISKKQKNEMLKDCHLIEAAIITDKRIISLDDSVRQLFVCLSISVVEMQDVQWVNPGTENVQVMIWLSANQEEAVWKLGHKALAK